jgi:ribosomal protein S17E
MAYLTKNETSLITTFLRQIRDCFDKNRKLVEEYYQNIIL